MEENQQIQEPQAQESAQRKRKKHAHAKKTSARSRIFLIVVGVIAALAIIGALSAWAVVTIGGSNMRAPLQDAQTAEDAVTYDEGRTVQYNGHTYKYNENMVSLCLIGYDRRSDANLSIHSGQSDAIMVLAVDSVTGKMTSIVVPRDSMVEVGEYMGDLFAGMEQLQICRAFTYGDGAEESCQFVIEAVQRTLYNMPLDYFVALNMQSVGPLANQVGGVSLTALETIPGTNIVEGQDTVLMGNNALKYVQYRDTNKEGSSILRQNREVQFVKQFMAQALDQVKSGGGVGVLLDLYSTASEYAVTNLGATEFAYLASVVAANGVGEIEVRPLQGEMTRDGIYAEYYLDKVNVYETVLATYYTQVD